MSMGKPLPHDAAPLHVTGQARYVDDIPAARRARCIWPSACPPSRMGEIDGDGPVRRARRAGRGRGAVGRGSARHAGLLALGP